MPKLTKTYLLFLYKLLVCCLITSPVFGQTDSIKEFKLSPLDTNLYPKHQAWGTYYYIHQFESAGNIQLLLGDNSTTDIYADTCDFCLASLEGTAIIKTKDGVKVTLNYDRTDTTKGIDCRKCLLLKKSNVDTDRLGRIRWKYADGYGLGVKNYKLIPYRTIAVDSNYIPFGSVIFIPKIKGLKFMDENNNQKTHDGYFFAGDTGSAIKGNHFDFFLGTTKINPFKNVITSSINNTFYFYICTDNKINRFF